MRWPVWVGLGLLAAGAALYSGRAQEAPPPRWSIISGKIVAEEQIVRSPDWYFYRPIVKGKLRHPDGTVEEGFHTRIVWVDDQNELDQIDSIYNVGDMITIEDEGLIITFDDWVVRPENIKKDYTQVE